MYIDTLLNETLWKGCKWSKDRQRTSDVKAIPGEKIVQQHQLLVCDIMK